MYQVVLPKAFFSLPPDDFLLCLVRTLFNLLRFLCDIYPTIIQKTETDIVATMVLVKIGAFSVNGIRISRGITSKSNGWSSFWFALFPCKNK